MNDHEFKVGDHVAVSEPYGLPRKGEVVRLTKTQVVVSVINTSRGPYEIRFRRKDGCLVGGDQWSRSHILPWTDADDKVAERQALSLKVRNINWHDLSNDQLRRVLEIVNEA